MLCSRTHQHEVNSRWMEIHRQAKSTCAWPVCLFFQLYSHLLRSFTMTIRRDERGKRKRRMGQMNSGKFAFFCKSVGVWRNIKLMADSSLNYSDCLKIWGSSHWLFCQMLLCSVLGTVKTNSENNSFVLLIGQLVICKADMQMVQICAGPVTSVFFCFFQLSYFSLLSLLLCCK